VSEDDTLDEASQNIKEATVLYLEADETSLPELAIVEEIEI